MHSLGNLAAHTNAIHICIPETVESIADVGLTFTFQCEISIRRGVNGVNIVLKATTSREGATVYCFVRHFAAGVRETAWIL